MLALTNNVPLPVALKMLRVHPIMSFLKAIKFHAGWPSLLT
jgi:hypothetical protein